MHYAILETESIARSIILRLCCLVNFSALSPDMNSITADRACWSTWAKDDDVQKSHQMLNLDDIVLSTWSFFGQAGIILAWMQKYCCEIVRSLNKSFLSTHPFIYTFFSSMHPFIHTSFQLHILLSVHPFICTSFYLYIRLSVHPFIYTS